MTTITANHLKNEKNIQREYTQPTFLTRYWAYAEKAQEENVFWFLKTIMVIPCVVMIPAIFAMAMITPHYVWFVGLTVLLFFANVIAHIGGAKGNLFVPLYHATIGILFLIPLVTYLITL